MSVCARSGRSSTRSDMKLDALFNAAGADPTLFPVIMPLSASIKVEDPEDVLGFAWRRLYDEDNLHVVTIPGRCWEKSAQWTGLDADYYNEHCVRGKPLDDEELRDALRGPIVSYAPGVLRRCLAMLDTSAMTLDIQRVFATCERQGLNPLEKDDPDLGELVGWLNRGASLRVMSRKNMMESHGIRWDDRSGTRVLGMNTAMDAAMWRHALELDVRMPEKQEEVSEESPFDEG